MWLHLKYEYWNNIQIVCFRHYSIFFGGLKEVALQCGFVLIVEDCLVTSFSYVLDFACYRIVVSSLFKSL
jgi:hypothetical protein